MSDDEAKVTALASRAATWWDRARVTVLGVSILGAVVSTAYVVGVSQTEILGQISSVAERVSEVRDAVRVMAVRLDEHGVSLSDVHARLGKLELAREEQGRNIQLFWSRDWADLRTRVERVEHLIMGLPTMRERAAKEPQR